MVRIEIIAEEIDNAVPSEVRRDVAGTTVRTKLLDRCVDVVGDTVGIYGRMVVGRQQSVPFDDVFGASLQGGIERFSVLLLLLLHHSERAGNGFTDLLLLFDLDGRVFVELTFLGLLGDLRTFRLPLDGIFEGSRILCIYECMYVRVKFMKV